MRHYVGFLQIGSHMEIMIASHLSFYNNGSVLHMNTLASKEWHGKQAIKAVNNNSK